MRQFGHYPIYINYADHWEDVRQRQIREFAARHDTKMVNWLRGTAKQLYEITEDKTPSAAARNFEDQVHDLLQKKISVTTLGKMLLNSLNRNVQYWIVPLDAENQRMCQCGALTFPGAPKEGGGLRIYFNPTDWEGGTWQMPDDVLFHELVHAYRIARIGFYAQNKTPMSDYDNGEEFLALQMQNMYLADRGSQRFYLSYRRPWLNGSKDDAYQYYAGAAEVPMALRYFREKEPLATGVSHWKAPANGFNPWRDQPLLEQAYLKEVPGIDRLPPFQ
jgi:hypothetical protein